MYNGARILYIQFSRVKRALRLGILTTLEVQKLAELQTIATLPERHETPMIDCRDCIKYGKDDECHCHGEGVEPDATFHCGVEGCYQCEIWPLQ